MPPTYQVVEFVNIKPISVEILDSVRNIKGVFTNSTNTIKTKVKYFPPFLLKVAKFKHKMTFFHLKNNNQYCKISGGRSSKFIKTRPHTVLQCQIIHCGPISEMLYKNYECNFQVWFIQNMYFQVLKMIEQQESQLGVRNKFGLSQKFDNFKALLPWCYKQRPSNTFTVEKNNEEENEDLPCQKLLALIDNSPRRIANVSKSSTGHAMPSCSLPLPLSLLKSNTSITYLMFKMLLLDLNCYKSQQLSFSSQKVV